MSAVSRECIRHLEHDHPKKPKILQVFSRYREYGGEESRVFRIGDAMNRDFDVGFYLVSSEAKRLKELERENTELKNMLADSLLENRVLKFVCERKL